MPFFSPFFPKIQVFGVNMRLPVIITLMYFLLAIEYFILYPYKIKVPKYAIWFSIYIIFSISNTLIQNSYQDENWANLILYEYVFPLTFIVLIENIKYDEKDIKRLIKILSIVIIGGFFVSIIQFFINPFFYKSVNLSDVDKFYASQFVVGGYYRAYSLYSGMKAYDVVFAVIYLFNIFIFLYLLMKKRKYLILSILIFISGILTLGRDIAVSMFVSILFYLYYKHKKTWLLNIGLPLLMLLFVWTIYSDSIKETSIYQNRVVAITYQSRLFSPVMYFEHFFLDKPFFGYGESSGSNTGFKKYYHVIHVLWFNMMFQNGIVGLIIYLIFLYHIYKRGRKIYAVTENPVFMIIVISYFIVNSTAPYDLINFYGSYFMFFYLAMNYKLYVKKECSTKVFNRSPLYIKNN